MFVTLLLFSLFERQQQGTSSSQILLVQQDVLLPVVLQVIFQPVLLMCAYFSFFLKNNMFDEWDVSL